VTVTLDRPDVTNSMNGQMFAELNEAFEQFHEKADKGELDVVTVSGAGDHFSAGADLHAVPAWDEQTPREIWADFELFHETYGLIEDLPVPVIAAVEGYCLAAGLELAISCDFIVARENSTFALPESEKGLAMDFGGAQKLPGMIGEKNAMYLVLTSESIDAERAHTWGLVQELVQGEDALAARVAELEDKLASFPSYVLGFNKDEVLSTRPENIDDAMKVAIAYAVSVYKEPETQEIVGDFLES
jgi:enoyl-CoA hydratase